MLRSDTAGEGNPSSDVSEPVRENEQLKERIKALEDTVKNLVVHISQPLDRPSSTSTVSHPDLDQSHFNPPFQPDLSLNEGTLSNSPIAKTPIRDIIDLRPSLTCRPLQDDIRCAERLSRSDQGHPHVRLGLLWHIVYMWCDKVHDIAAETWLKIIEGDDQDEGLWLWEDGDEVSLSNLLFRVQKASDLEYNAPVFLYAATLRESVADLTADDWNHAMLAIRRRLNRSSPSTPCVDAESALARPHFTAERIRAFIWLLVLSKPMRDADGKRGVRRLLLGDSADGLLDRWIQIHLLFDRFHSYLPEIMDDDNYCHEIKEWFNEQGEWMAYLSMFYDVQDIKVVCQEMIGSWQCFDGCIRRIDKHLEPRSDSIPPIVLTPFTPSLRSMFNDTMVLNNSPGSVWQSMPSLAPTNCIDIYAPAPELPMWLVTIWFVFDHALSCSGITPTVQRLLSQIEAAGRDEFLDIWSWSHEEDKWLERNITMPQPSADCAPWLNKFPYSWRHRLTRLTVDDWRRLQLATVHRRNEDGGSPYHFRAPTPLSLPKDGLLWIGSMVWLFLENLEPGDRKVYSRVAPLDAAWFSRMQLLGDLVSALNFPSIQLTAATAKFRRAVVSSGHRCYRHSESAMAQYAALRWWLHYNDSIPITGIDTYLTWSDRSCDSCKAAPQWRLKAGRAGINSVYSLEIALKAFMPQMDQDNAGHIPRWLEAYSRDILAKVANFSAFTEREQSQCFDLVLGIPIYQRFLVYTFAHVKLCEDDDRLLYILKTSMAAWTTWDDINSILNHRIIYGQLWALLRSTKNARYQASTTQTPEYFHYTPHACDTGDNLKELLDLDILAICARMSNILNDPDGRRSFMSCQGKEAQALLNLLQAFLDYPQVISVFKSQFQGALFQLSRKSGLYPECLVLRDLELDGAYVDVVGTFGDIRKGAIHGSAIAVKQLRINGSNVTKVLKDFSHEVVIWRQLSHPNVVPFYGVYHLNNNRTLVCLVSPWMENGTITHFLERNPNANRVLLTLDVAQGLEYIHTLKPHIIHGDLKGVNILITPSHRACLVDFGLSAAGESRVLQQSSSSNARATGTIRWEAPELLAPETEGNTVIATSTRASDIYSFACVCYEIFSDRIPHYEIMHHNSVILLVCNGKRPIPLPDQLRLSRGLDDDMWLLMEACWKHVPSGRPTATAVVQRLRDKLGLIKDSRPPSDWDDSFILRLRSNLAGHPFCPPAVDMDVTASKREIYRNTSDTSFDPLQTTNKRLLDLDSLESQENSNKRLRVT